MTEVHLRCPSCGYQWHAATITPWDETTVEAVVREVRSAATDAPCERTAAAGAIRMNFLRREARRP